MAKDNGDGAAALIQKLESIAPAFARAEADILATTGRARALDYRGVLQNARLVTETLMRDIYTREIGSPPGKKMLGDLVSQFRQSSNAKIIPVEVLIFVDGIAAAGNLGSHDHSGLLNEQGIRITAAHAMPALSNLLALLEWYSEKYLELPADVKTSTVANHNSHGHKSILAGICAVAAVSAIWVAGSREDRSDRFVAQESLPQLPPSYAREVQTELSSVGAVPVARSPSEIIAEWYVKRDDLRPPESCSAKGEGMIKLAFVVGLDAKKGMEALTADGRKLSPEEQFVQAVLITEAAGSARDFAESAARCPGFAAAQNLAGRLALKDGRPDRARTFFEAATLSRPDYLKPRFNMTLAMMAQGDFVEAGQRLEELALLMPNRGEVQSALATARAAVGKAEAAREAWCRAATLGVAEAKNRCDDR